MLCNLSANLIIKTLISFAVEIRSFLKFSASFSDLVVFFSSKKSILVKPSTKFVILGPKFSFNSNFENFVSSITSWSKPVITVSVSNFSSISDLQTSYGCIIYGSPEARN